MYIVIKLYLLYAHKFNEVWDTRLEATHWKLSCQLTCWIFLMCTLVKFLPWIGYSNKTLNIICPKIFFVATLAFGLRLRQGGWEVAGLEADPRVTSHAPGSAKSAKSVREWTLTLPSEFPCWELVRVGVPKGLPKLQRAFWGVKTPWLVALFISMESSWSVDV